MWFAVEYIASKHQPVFWRIFPQQDPVTWKGFGWDEKHELINRYQEAQQLNAGDIVHIRKLWKAFVHRQEKELDQLSHVPTRAIRFQEEIIQAQNDRRANESGFGRPQRTLLKLLAESHTSFYDLFAEFEKTESIYGFGDVQVKLMLEELGYPADL
jgi:hypothetical protein